MTEGCPSDFDFRERHAYLARFPFRRRRRTWPRPFRPTRKLTPTLPHENPRHAPRMPSDRQQRPEEGVGMGWILWIACGAYTVRMWRDAGEPLKPWEVFFAGMLGPIALAFTVAAAGLSWWKQRDERVFTPLSGMLQGMQVQQSRQQMELDRQALRANAFDAAGLGQNQSQANMANDYSRQNAYDYLNDRRWYDADTIGG